MASLEELMRAQEESEQAVDETLVEPKMTLPMIQQPQPVAQPAAPSAQGPVTQGLVPDPIELFQKGLDGLGLGRYDIKAPIERSADWLYELFTNREKEERQKQAGVDVRHQELPDPIAESVRGLQSSVAAWNSMLDIEPEFTKNAAEGMLAAIFNQNIIPGQPRLNPEDFNVRSSEGRLVFNSPLARGRPTPLDPYDLTSEDFGQALSDMKPFVWELTGAVLGTVGGTAAGIGVSALTGGTTAMPLAQKMGVVSGVVGEALAAIQVQYDMRVDALTNQGFRPTRWLMPEDDPEDKSIPEQGKLDDTGKGAIRWVFWNTGPGEGQGRWDPTSRETYSDAEVFTKGARGKALWAAGGALGGSVLYKLYRWNKGNRAANQLGSIVDSRDFERALRSQRIEINKGNLADIAVTTPQVLLRYADELSLRATREEARKNVKRAAKLREAEAKYREDASTAQNLLQGLGGAKVGTQAAQRAVREVVERETDQPVSQVQVGGRVGGDLTTRDISDEQLRATGEQVTAVVRQQASETAQIGLNTFRGSIRKLEQTLLSGNLRVSLDPGQSVSNMATALSKTKDLLFSGEKSFFTTQVYGPIRKNMNNFIPGGKKIEIFAPQQLRLARRRVELREQPLPDIDDFIKSVSATLTLPKPTKEGERVFGIGQKVPITATLDTVNRQILELRSNIAPKLKTGAQKREAKLLDQALINLRKHLVEGSDQYKNVANAAEQKEIRKALQDFNDADGLYNQAQELYSRGNIDNALSKLDTDLPYAQRATEFFKQLIPPGSSPEEVANLLKSLDDPIIGIKTLESTSTKNLLASGLYETWRRRVTGRGTTAEQIAGGQAKLTDVFDISEHKKFIDEYGPVLKSLLPETKDYDELINNPEKLFNVAQNDLRKYAELKKAFDSNADLKGLIGTFDDFRTALDSVLTKSPSSYRNLRGSIENSTLERSAKKDLLRDMDDAVRALFIRKISKDSPALGSVIDGEKLAKIFVKPALMKERQEGEMFGDALSIVFNKTQMNRLQRMGRDLQLLEQAAKSAEGFPTVWPELTGSILDSRKPLGALARVYVGVLNTRARALTAAQRVLGTKAGDVLLEALLDPKKAEELLRQRIPKPGMLKSSLINLVGATTGVYWSMDEAEDVEELSGIKKVSSEELEQESKFRRKVSIPKVDEELFIDIPSDQIDFRLLEKPVSIPGLNIPAAERIPEFLRKQLPKSLQLQYPGTISAPPVVEKGIGAIQRGAVDLLRRREENKLTGAPFNSGGIVQAVPRRARQRVL